MATLVILQGQHPGQQFPLGQERQVIGRALDAAIHLPSHVVSRRHAQVSCENGTYVVEDLGSHNGTYLNGRRIAGREALSDGDQLTLSDYVLGFQTDAPEAEATGILEQ